MEILSTIFYFIVTLGILVFIHELGHFLAAKLFGMRVDTFSLGFPPRAFGKQIGETDYCISWIPIGGYVKIAGMIDESFDTEYLEQEPQPWEYRSKPIWQRMIVISAGVIMNVLLAVAIFWGINYTQGKTVWDTTEIGYVVRDSQAEKAGLMRGDKILTINNQPMSNWEDIRNHVYLENFGNEIVFSLLRNGQRIEVKASEELLKGLNESSFGIGPSHTETYLEAVDAGKPAAAAGLKRGDILVSLDSIPLPSGLRVTEIVKSHAGKPLAIEWRRGDTLMNAIATPSEKGLIGVQLGERYVGPMTKTEYSALQALTLGFKNAYNVIDLTIKGVSRIFVGKASFSESVAGPIRIAKIASQAAEVGIGTYLIMMAFLSMSLAFLNILPIPALDGGHLLFLVVEGIIGRELPVKLKLVVQRAGFILLICFMAFALFNDIRSF